MDNMIISKLKKGQTALGLRIVESRTPGMIKILVDAGFDWVFIDCEHGSYNMETLLDLNRYCNAVGICPVVKVPALEKHLISRPLDQGAMGVIVPQIESAEQAKAAVRFTRFPPVGERGCGLDSDYCSWKTGTLEYIAWANMNILLVLQIESQAAIENIDEIAEVKGIDVLLVGPLDLSVSLGVPGETNHPVVVKSMEKVAAACEKNGLVFGFPGSAQSAAKWHGQGARFICAGSDTTIMAEGCKETIRAFIRKSGLCG